MTKSGHRRGLENFLYDNVESLTSEEQTRIGILISQFEGATPLRPRDFFDVNYSTGGSILGLIITYLIVLMQFKLSE